MKTILIAAVVACLTFPAAAQECTEEKVDALAQELGTLMAEKGTTDEQLADYAAEVEAHYGGEPTDAQTCEAIGMLIERVAKD